jgi:hypothetical protein
MKITGIQYRNFYPQKSLNFDFKVYNYSSNHFEVGITGTHYVRYLFKSGIIKDPNDNIIGTFNKEPISINSYIKEPFSEGSYVQGYTTYKDYLNSAPITREGVLATPTSIFSALVVKILDAPVSNSVDLDAFIYGDSIPELKFSNFYSNTGVSGKITNMGEYIVDIFSINSTSITGQFTHAKEIQPGNYINFFNNDTSGYSQGFPVYLNLETNFGNQSYSLVIQNDQVVNDDAQVDNTDPIVFEPILWSTIQPYQGDIIQTGLSQAFYRIDYILGEDGSKIDLDFQYTDGKTGDLNLTGSSTDFFGTESINVSYSGFLFTQNGIASGLLYNTDFEKIKPDYSLKGNQQDITFYSLSGTLSQYFEDLKATGEVVYTVQANDGLPINKTINDQELDPDYFIDLGGKTGLPITLIDQTLNYERLSNYKTINIPNNFAPFDITGVVDTEDMEGKFTFGKYEFLAPSSVLIHSKNLPTNIISTNVDIYPYRGVGYATLYDQSIILSGDPEGSNIPFLFLDNDSDVLLFKNLSNIDYNGQYTIQPKIDLLKGKVLNDDVNYLKNGGGFADQTEYKGGLFINSLIEDGIQTYRNLTPFENVEDVENDLYKREDNGSLTKINYGINWSENNFMALNKENDITAFYSDSDNFNLGITLQDRNFLKDKTVSTSINLITETIVEELVNFETFTATESFEGLTNPVFQGYQTPNSVNEDTLYKIKFNFVKNDQAVNDYIFSFYYRKGVPLPAETGVPNILIFQNETYTITDFDGNPESGSELARSTEYVILDSQNLPQNVAYPNDIARIWIKLTILEPNGSIDLKLVNQLTTAIFVDGSNSKQETKFNPKEKQWSFYIFGAQLEETDIQRSKDPSFYNAPVLKEEKVTVYRLSAFEYFVYTLYGIPGEFINTWSQTNLDYKAYDTKTRELKRSSCGNIKCFESEFEDYASKQKTRDRLNRYKGVYYNASSLYRFFVAEIYNKLINVEENEYLKIYTDLDKLYISKGTEISIYTRNDDKYIYASPAGPNLNTAPFNAVNEILDLLIKYKNFTYKNITLETYNYKVPESYGVTLSPIPKNKLDTILFSGSLNKNLDLNIQAGFCRYYLPSNDSKDFGYFYETTNFYDVNNRDLIDVQDSNASFTKLFPDTRELINNRPKKNISSTLNVPFSRLVKNNNPIEVEKTINFTAYVQSCFFKKEIQNVLLDLTGTFYNIKKRISQVWTIKIKNSLDDNNPSYSSVGKTIGNNVDTYQVKSFANIVSTDTQTKYLEVTHDDMEEIPLNENDKAVITLTSYLSENDPAPVISTFSIP